MSLKRGSFVQSLTIALVLFNLFCVLFSHPDDANAAPANPPRQVIVNVPAAPSKDDGGGNGGSNINNAPSPPAPAPAPPAAPAPPPAPAPPSKPAAPPPDSAPAPAPPAKPAPPPAPPSSGNNNNKDPPPSNPKNPPAAAPPTDNKDQNANKPAPPSDQKNPPPSDSQNQPPPKNDNPPFKVAYVVQTVKYDNDQSQALTTVPVNTDDLKNAATNPAVIWLTASNANNPMELGNVTFVPPVLMKSYAMADVSLTGPYYLIQLIGIGVPWLIAALALLA